MRTGTCATFRWLEAVRLPAEIRYQLAGLQFINFELLGFENSAGQLVTVLKRHQKKTEPAEKKQAEIVIQGVDISAFDEDKQKELLAFISNLANTDTSRLAIVDMTAGSVHAFVDMPADTAYQLKTMALNGDNRFGNMGIASLRLNGDTKFIYITLGIFTAASTLGFASWLWMKVYTIFANLFGIAIANIMMALTSTVVVAGVGLTAMNVIQPSAPAKNAPITATAAPSSTATATLTLTPTSTLTVAPTFTLTPTETAEPSLQGVDGSVLDHTTCFYGPDSYFLFRYGVIEGNKIQVFGKDINNLWAYVQVEGYEGYCWLRLRQIKFDGTMDELKVLYPGEVSLPLSFLWPVPQNVETARTVAGDKMSIVWDAYILPDGEMESPESPRYMLELWTCQGGVLSFGFQWIWALPEILITDEPGCSEPSHGNIYLVEKHGYAGPVEIPWPPYPTP